MSFISKDRPKLNLETIASGYDCMAAIHTFDTFFVIVKYLLSSEVLIELAPFT